MGRGNSSGEVGAVLERPRGGIPGASTAPEGMAALGGSIGGTSHLEGIIGRKGRGDLVGTHMDSHTHTSTGTLA